MLAQRKYDVISMEITSVWFAGATSVYSREFYDEARRHLQSGGVLQQWVQLHHLTLDEIGSTLATVRDVFSYVQLYVQGGQGVIVASEAPLLLHPAGLSTPTYTLSNCLPPMIVLLNLVSSELLSSEDIDRVIATESFTVTTDWNRHRSTTSLCHRAARSPYAEPARALATQLQLDGGHRRWGSGSCPRPSRRPSG